MSEREEMEIFLREMLMNIEAEQSQIIRKLEECHKRIEASKREKEIVEEKLKDNISFFNPSFAKNREKVDEISEEIIQGYKEIDYVKEHLNKINSRILIMGKILNFVKEQVNDEDDEEEYDFKVNGISILEAQEMERKRIARDLHDSTVQSLTNIVHKTEFCSKMIDRDPVQVKLELLNMMSNIRNSIDDMRRIIYDLRPMSIDDLGLVPTIQRFVDQNKKHYENINFKVKVSSESDDIDLPSVVTLTIFRIIQEACNNIFKYSEAENVCIEIYYGEEYVRVDIVDDGIGFELSEIGKGEKKNSGFGLSIMRERAQLLGGTLHIKTELEQGTTISVEVPYNGFEDEENLNTY